MSQGGARKLNIGQDKADFVTLHVLYALWKIKLF